MDNTTVTRVAVLVDLHYLDRLTEQAVGATLGSLTDLALLLASTPGPVRVLAYDAERLGDLNRKRQAQRLAALEAEGVVMKLRWHAFEDCSSCGARHPRQKGVDVELGLDLAELAASRGLRRIVLVAGDGDFVPAVERARSHGVAIHLAHGPGASEDLRAVCDLRTRLDLVLRDQARRLAA